MHKRLFILFLLLSVGLSACLKTTPFAETATATADATQPAAQEQKTEASPQALTPEDIVYSFLTAYEDNPDEMILYLSKSMKESLPGGGIIELLGFNGMVEGLVFQSGSGSPDSDLAVVEVHLQINQQEVIRKFTLLKQNDTWLITAIEQVDN